MPICPRCNTTFHAGAEKECPACGYSLARANAAFGEGQVEFTRVLDAAGALTHAERMELMRSLETLERRISPVALCIFLTDDGQQQDLRTHAHWILNHARIHHPSFGARDYRNAIEEAELKELPRGERNHPLIEQTPNVFKRVWNSLVSYARDRLHPVPPPVRQEWMLILVVDVQLEMACFSWGYMLDPYINPDSINSCIVKARLQFREREMVSGLKKVMTAAMNRIIADAPKVNRRMARHLPRELRSLLLAPLALGLLAAPMAEAAPTSGTKTSTKASAKPTPKKPTATTVKGTKSTTKPAAKQAAKPTSKPAATKAAVKPSTDKPSSKPAAKLSTTKPTVKPDTKKATAKPADKPTATKPTAKTAPKKEEKPKTAAAPALKDDDVAEEVDDTEEVAEEVTPAESTPAPTEAPAEATAQTPAAPAEAAPAAPEAEEDAASFTGAPRWKRDHYRLLMAGELATGYAALFPEAPPAAPKAATPKAAAAKAPSADAESDTTVLGRYCDVYQNPEKNTTLIDPQHLLTTPMTDDVLHVLHNINANERYRLCVAVFKGTQAIPGELSADTLVTGAAQEICDHAVLLVYPLGKPSEISLGYRGVELNDDRRHEWLQAARTAAAEAGGGSEGIIAALNTVNARITPMASSFKTINPAADTKQPLIQINFKNKEKEKEFSVREKLTEFLTNPAHFTLLGTIGGVLLVIAAVLLYLFFLRRHFIYLYDTPNPDRRLSAPYGAGVSHYVRYLEGKEDKDIF